MKTELIGVGGNPTSYEFALEKVSVNSDRLKEAEQLYKSAKAKFKAGNYKEGLEELTRAYFLVMSVKKFLLYII